MLPTRVYELSAWRGLDTYSPLTDTDQHYLAAVQNCDFDEEGVIAKRRGALKLSSTITGTINLIYDFQCQQGFTGSTDVLRTIIVAGSTLHVVSGFGVSGSGGTVDASFAATNQLHYGATSNNGACFISNEGGGVPKIVAYIGGAWRFISAALDAPALAPGIAAATTGSMTGIWSAAYTYVDTWGNESNPSTISATVSLSMHHLSVGVVASSDPSVTQINIFLLPPGGISYNLSVTSGNTSATISCSISADTVLASREVRTDHFTCPSGKYIQIYNNMLLVAGDPAAPDAIWISNTNRLRQFSSDTDVARVVSGDGQAVRGFGPIFGQMVIGKADSLFLAAGADNTKFRAVPHNANYGVLGQPSMTYLGAKHAFFSDDGFYLDDSLQPTELSRIIRRTLRSLNPANLASTPPKQFCANNKYYKQLFLAVREATGAGENDAMLVYNYELGTWTRYSGNVGRYLATVQNQDDYEYMFGGDNSGSLFLYTPPNGGSPNVDTVTGSTTAITAYAETPWMNFAKIDDVKGGWERVRTIPRFVEIYAGGEPAAGNSTISLVTTYYTDFSTTVRGTFTTTHNAAAWPTVTCQPKMIRYGGAVGTYRWIKFRFANALQEHFKLYKVAFGYKLKPAID